MQNLKNKIIILVSTNHKHFKTLGRPRGLHCTLIPHKDLQKNLDLFNSNNTPQRYTESIYIHLTQIIIFHSSL